MPPKPNPSPKRASNNLKKYTDAQFQKLVMPKLADMGPEEFHTLMTGTDFTPIQMQLVVNERSKTCNMAKMIQNDPKPNYLQYLLLGLEGSSTNFSQICFLKAIREHMEQSYNLKSIHEIIRLAYPEAQRVSAPLAVQSEEAESETPGNPQSESGTADTPIVVSDGPSDQ